ncbi:TRAP transporter small permease [Acetomicrobium sp. UBA5826]|uniref:TRAP transporter small permease n=1 Tax=Acetomicrobium sp. UBA5826 TaxID=1946039 RepID=UPI002580A8A9|nr:TRAP transporter small permease [Acetomicrobium sp. UBA5826]
MKSLTRMEEIVSVTVFLVMLSIMVIQVLYRYVLRLPLPWSEELARFLFVITTFFGAAIASNEKSHIEINLIDPISQFIKSERHREAFIKVVQVIGNMISLAVVCTLAYYSVKYAYFLTITNQVSPAMGLQLSWIVCAMVVGLILMCIHYLDAILQSYSKSHWGMKK